MQGTHLSAVSYCGRKLGSHSAAINTSTWKRRNLSDTESQTVEGLTYINSHQWMLTVIFRNCFE